MKSYTLLFALMSFGYSGNILIAQDIPASGITPSEVKKGKELVIMYKGYVWHRSNGVSLLVSNEVIVGGTKVKADGTVVFQDGRTTKMKEGDFVESDGSLFQSSRENSIP